MGSHNAREDVVRSMLLSGELVLPMPGCGRTARRWASLADWGRSDLAVARLAEGHTDAVAILVEAGLSPEPDMLYGVWAARPGGLGAILSAGESTGSTPHGVLLGSARFCSGARILDRALVVAQPSSSTALVLAEVRLDRDGARPDPASWQADGMAGSDTLDVEFTDLPVQRTVGGPGWYTARRGLGAGGGGVAAVWGGGASGVLRRAFEHLRGNDPDQHQLAHLGELHHLARPHPTRCCATRPTGPLRRRVRAVSLLPQCAPQWSGAAVRRWTGYRAFSARASGVVTGSLPPSWRTFRCMSVSTTASGTAPGWRRHCCKVGVMSSAGEPAVETSTPAVAVDPGGTDTAAVRPDPLPAARGDRRPPG